MTEAAPTTTFRATVCGRNGTRADRKTGSVTITFHACQPAESDDTDEMIRLAVEYALDTRYEVLAIERVEPSVAEVAA